MLKSLSCLIHQRVENFGPLMPSPTPNNTKSTSYSTKPTPYCDRIHSADIFAWNHHNATEQSKKEIPTEPLVSSRWNPTPEQLQTLEEMYRSGIRTHPRLIKSKGRMYSTGFRTTKQEKGKNDGLKLDRRTEQPLQIAVQFQRFQYCYIYLDSESIHRAVVAESRPDGWLKIEERELQQNAITASKNAMRQMTNSSSMSMSMSMSPTTKLIMKDITTTEQEDLVTTDPKLRSTQNLRLLEDITMVEDDETRGFQTRQLFPMKSDDDCGALKGDKNDIVEEPITATIAIGTHFKPNKFFELL
ncbi:unnamed protein product [Ilex paraguariensis]|uniref:Uncharacterized protein n=1 Tax=Ilex paraguariensis TaxID=185542 RepID=A0ABC8RCK0_9AQUA